MATLLRLSNPQVGAGQGNPRAYSNAQLDGFRMGYRRQLRDGLARVLVGVEEIGKTEPGGKVIAVLRKRVFKRPELCIEVRG